jgi:DNA-binding CsgD family transcriptional regulator
MLNQVTLLLTVLTLTTGVVSMAAMSWSYRTTPSPALRSFSKVILFFNLWIIVWLVRQYLWLHVVDDTSARPVRVAAEALLPVARLLQLAMMSSVIRLVWEVRSKTVPRRVRRVARWVLVASGVLLVAGFLYQVVASRGALFGLALSLVTPGINWGCLACCLTMLASARSIPDARRRRSVAFISAAYSLFLVGVLGLTAAGSLRLLPVELYRPLEVALDFCVNGAALWWVLRSARALSLAPVPGPAPATQNAITAAAARFGVSGREREVVELVCQGLSNQEIGARLFISDKTVKVHLHKVFQKVGVRNRTHLAQVFTRCPEATSPSRRE